MRSTPLKFGDADTSLREIADYVFAWLEDELSETTNTITAESFRLIDQSAMECNDRCLADLIEEALEAFYGGARNE